MSRMYQGCKSLINFELSNINTKSVTDMLEMFDGCESLKNIDLSKINTKMLLI